MRPESNFWNRLFRRIHAGKVRGYWQRVEVKLPLGFPDCVVILDGRVIFVELKSVEVERELKRELRAEQAVWMDKCNDNGGEAYVLAFIRSENRMLWYQHGRMMRQGQFMQVPAPRLIYAPTFDGTIVGR